MPNAAYEPSIVSQRSQSSQSSVESVSSFVMSDNGGLDGSPDDMWRRDSTDVPDPLPSEASAVWGPGKATHAEPMAMDGAGAGADADADDDMDGLQRAGTLKANRRQRPTMTATPFSTEPMLTSLPDPAALRRRPPNTHKHSMSSDSAGSSTSQSKTPMGNGSAREREAEKFWSGEWDSRAADGGAALACGRTEGMADDDDGGGGAISSSAGGVDMDVAREPPKPFPVLSISPTTPSASLPKLDISPAAPAPTAYPHPPPSAPPDLSAPPSPASQSLRSGRTPPPNLPPCDLGTDLNRATGTVYSSVYGGGAGSGGGIAARRHFSFDSHLTRPPPPRASMTPSLPSIGTAGMQREASRSRLAAPGGGSQHSSLPSSFASSSYSSAFSGRNPDLSSPDDVSSPTTTRSSFSVTTPSPPVVPFLDARPPPAETDLAIETTDTDYSLFAVLPGFSLDCITLATKQHRTLHIVADRWEEEAGGHFERRVTFGKDAEMSKVTAAFDGNVLRITVPRRQPRAPSSSASARSGWSHNSGRGEDVGNGGFGWRQDRTSDIGSDRSSFASTSASGSSYAPSIGSAGSGRRPAGEWGRPI